MSTVFNSPCGIVDSLVSLHALSSTFNIQIMGASESEAERNQRTSMMAAPKKIQAPVELKSSESVYVSSCSLCSQESMDAFP